VKQLFVAELDFFRNLVLYIGLKFVTTVQALIQNLKSI
jgi:hypothetical protein